MNGGINGIMEESKELSHVDSFNTDIVTAEDTGLVTKPKHVDFSNTEIVTAEDTGLDTKPKHVDFSNTEIVTAEDISLDNHFEINNKDSNDHEDSQTNIKLSEDPDIHLNSKCNLNSNSIMDHNIDSTQDNSEVGPIPETVHLSSIENTDKGDGIDIYNSDSNGSNTSTECTKEEVDNMKTQDDPLSLDKNCDSKLFKDSVENLIPSNNGEVVEEHSEDDEASEVSGEPEAVDTVSVHSDSDMDTKDESSQDCQSNEVILPGNRTSESHNGTSKNVASPEVHEIISDNEDCVIEEVKKKKKVSKENPVPLRRSSRAIKRKRYDDDAEDEDEQLDLEEMVVGDSFKRKSKAIYINDTKALIDMAAKQIKQNSHKKQCTEVIIDINSYSKGNSMKKNSFVLGNSTLSTQNLYQGFIARGTTVTPVSSKNMSTKNSCTSQPQPSILPSLTDDMFVVEAPSFIVPYVYEKPSIEPFREFVDNLGKELEEQRAKEEKEEKEKEKEKQDVEKMEKEDKEKKEQESEEETKMEKEMNTDDKTEDGDDKKEEGDEKTDETKEKEKGVRKERRRPKNDDDDASWDGESSSDSDDDIASDDEQKTVVIKDKVEAIEDIQNVTDFTVEKVVTGKSDNYFDLSLGKFFMNIGLNRVQEFVQNDLLKQQTRKLYREKKVGHSTKVTESSIASLRKNLEFSKENNAPYKFKEQKCEQCTFKSESQLVMSHHLETPHMKNNIYKCNYCVYENRSPHDILYHMEAEHNSKGRLERAPAYHQCANCPFEDNGKGKLARHLIPCAKKFKPEVNLAPPIEWEPPAKIPKIARSRNSMMNSYQNAFHRGQVGNNIGRPPISNMMAGTSFRPRGRSPMPIGSRSIQGISILRGGVTVRQGSPSILISSNYPTANNGKNTASKSSNQPSISITPLPRQPQPQSIPAPPNSQQNNSCVVCEICDGYIKDLEQLRNHMQWIHKVKIHPKMIYNRPPLNCQKCQFRFFTDQGLERHLLGSHGLVTSSMQEAANKGKDSGRCPVCGKVYQWKLLSHVAKDHNLTLKPAHLSYKCTVCTATFGMYKQFENHVYSAHSVVAKRVMDKGKTAPPVKPGQSLLKPLKINDEITIIPQPVKSTTPPPEEDNW